MDNSKDKTEYSEPEVDEDGGLLITDLPLEVIVHIYDYLPLIDRHNSSITCHILYEAFNHPLLWRTQKLIIVTDIEEMFAKHNSQRQKSLPEKTRTLISRFGKYFQFLTITIVGEITSMEAWNPVLYELGQQCRLEKLVLHVGRITTTFDYYFEPPPTQGLEALLSFIQNAFRMKSLDIKSWPIFPDHTPDIFKAILNNPRFKDLEQLDLFWPYKSQMWSERAPVLPSAEMVLDLIRHLSGLTELGLRSNMITPELLDEISDKSRTKLNRLKIFVTSSSGRDGIQIPNISPSYWKKITNANPKICVECHIMTRVSNMELSNLLTLECPLSKIVFLQWARLDSQLIESLSTKYHTTLKTFYNYCDASDIDEALIKMAKECKMLDMFIFKTNGLHVIKRDTVVKLAEIRGSEWKTFMLNENAISYVNKVNEIDEDSVIAKNEKGEYVLVGLLNFHREPEGTERDEKRKALSEQLSSILGSKFVSHNQIFISG